MIALIALNLAPWHQIQSSLSGMLSVAPAFLVGTGDRIWQSALDGSGAHGIYCRVAVLVLLLPLWLLGATADT